MPAFEPDAEPDDYEVWNTPLRELPVRALEDYIDWVIEFRYASRNVKFGVETTLVHVGRYVGHHYTYGEGIWTVYFEGGRSFQVSTGRNVSIRKVFR